MNPTRDRLVEDYLTRLNAALDGVPRERQREIVEDVASHIDAARAELDPGDEAGLRALLDRVGDPEQIADDARGEPRAGRGRMETAAIVLLLVGGFIFGFGWLVGVVLLWLSGRWRVRDKLIGTLFVPGGLALPFTLLLFVGISGGAQLCTSVTSTSTNGAITTAQHCTTQGGESAWAQAGWIALLLALTAAAIVAAVHLARRSR